MLKQPAGFRKGPRILPRIHLQEQLSELVPSQWGPVHLFDLCLWFSHVDTALALASHGVKGCILQSYHLGALPDASATEDQLSCRCQGWETCCECCWGFPSHRGLWMNDWKAPLKEAINAAQRASQMPLINLLELCGEQLMFEMSSQSAARLLDIAILCGNHKTATNLAKNCLARPLRRWRRDELLPFSPFQECRMLPVICAALCAGADFDLEALWLDGMGLDCSIPFLRAVALDFQEEHWQIAGSFLPTSRWPSSSTHVGHHFLSLGHEGKGYNLSLQRIQNAIRAGWDCNHIWIPLAQGRSFHDASLLDLALLCGTPLCADLLADAGAELARDCLPWHRRASGGRSLQLRSPAGVLSVGSASECKAAASAAARACLKRSFNRVSSEKGLAVYQLLSQKLRPKHFPVALVPQILGFAMQTPKILDQLDLWNEVSSWIPSITSLPSRFSELADGEDAVSTSGLNVERVQCMLP